MKTIRLLLAVAALAAAPAAWAQTITPLGAGQIAPSRLALGRELAEALNSEANTLAVLETMLSESMPKALLADANVAEMERLYPGVIAEMIAAMKPLMIDYMRGELPSLWDRLAPLYARNLTEAEMRDVLAFYRGPAGQRIIAVMMQTVDFEPMLREMAQSGDYVVSDAAIDNATMGAAEQLPGQLNAGERAAVLRFAATPAGRKFMALTDQAKTIVVAWSSEPTPELDAKLETAVMAVVERRLGRPIGQ